MTEADKEDSVLVAITRDGKFYLESGSRQHRRPGREGYRPGEQSKLDKTIFVKGDFRAKYGDVVQVVDNLRAAGVDKIGLLTERLDDQVRQ